MKNDTYENNLTMNYLEKIRQLFLLIYGVEQKALIESRMRNLVALVFYDKLDYSDQDDVDCILIDHNIKIFNEEIKNGEIPFSKYVVSNGLQGMMPFYKNNKLNIVIYFPRKTPGNLNYDCLLIHELLHVLEEHIVVAEPNLVITRGGFELMTLVGESENERSYEYVNELLHQRIAEDILQIAIENNINFGNTYVENRESQRNYKLDMNPVIEKFYQKFKKEILSSKLLGKTDDFIDMIGREHFILFNSWLNDFFNKYATILKRKQMSDSKNEMYLKDLEEGNKIVDFFNVKKN